MKAIVCRYSMPKGIRTKYWTNQVTTVATVMTKVTAIPIPRAVSTFLETPRNGQMPRKRANTKLLTKIALTKITRRSAIRLKYLTLQIGLASGYKAVNL